MKILCISNYYPPFFEGGYEISVKESMDYMAARGHEIFILCGYKGAEQSSFEHLSIKAGIPLRILRYIDYLDASIKNKHEVEKFNYFITQKILDFTNPDIVYFGSMKAVSISPVLAVQRSGHKRVFDLGDIWLKSYTPPNLKSRIMRLAKSLLPFTITGKVWLDPVIAVSDWLAKEVAALYHSKNVFVVPCGIALPAANQRPLKAPLRFVFMGRIEPMKGLDLCIQAAGRVVAEHQDFVVDIYGEADETYLQQCKKQIQRLHLDHHFQFKGKTDNPLQILAQYDVLIMPTLAREAFGRVIIEAMACSLIVLATDAFGPKEIITSERDGFLFPRASAPQLSALILKLFATDTRVLEQIRSNARLKVEQYYEINLVKDKIENILNNIVNQTK